MTPADAAQREFSGRRVLVSGGSRGIGRAIAEAFAQAGAAVSICARGVEGLEDASTALASHGARVHSHPCDLADGGQIERWIAEAANALGGIDVVVNNASALSHAEGDAAWQAGFDVDLMAVVRCSRLALAHLRRSQDAAILNIGSINALRPTPRAPAYSTLKAAVTYYTLTQAAELAGERIRVNAIAPGSIEFPGGLWAKRRDSDPDLYARTLGSIPFGALGNVADVASAALFLCSPRARWITGQVLAVDGGQSLGVQ